MKFIILSAAFLVSLAYCTADPFGSREHRGPPPRFPWWPIFPTTTSTTTPAPVCPTVTASTLSTDPFGTGGVWYLAQRSPSIGTSTLTCTTYNFGGAYGTSPVNHVLTITRKFSSSTTPSVSVSILSQPSTATTYETWNNIHSTADIGAPSSYTVLGEDSATTPTWIVLYFCQNGVANVRILTNSATPTTATLQAAQAVVTSFLPSVTLTSVSQAGC